MQRYKTVRAVHHNGLAYPPGAAIDLSDTDAGELLALLVVTPETEGHGNTGDDPQQNGAAAPAKPANKAKK